MTVHFCKETISKQYVTVRQGVLIDDVNQYSINGCVHLQTIHVHDIAIILYLPPSQVLTSSAA